MAKGTPSAVALLGLLAVAGYQNRAKLSELLEGAGRDSAGRSGQSADRSGQPAQGSDFLSDLRARFGGAGAGGALAEGLNSLIEQFRGAGRADLADNWVSKGENTPVEPEGLEAALGAETLADLEARTGLSRSEILSRLSRSLPSAVDDMTPEGHLPSESEASRYI
jgi:uncharacterized protein YidB (DUF937 family)